MSKIIEIDALADELQSLLNNYNEEIILNLKNSLPYFFEIDSIELNLFEFIELNSNVRFSNINRDLDKIYQFILKNINIVLAEKTNRYDKFIILYINSIDIKTFLCNIS